MFLSDDFLFSAPQEGAPEFGDAQWVEWFFSVATDWAEVLLMAEILHQFIGSLSHYL